MAVATATFRLSDVFRSERIVGDVQFPVDERRDVPADAFAFVSMTISPLELSSVPYMSFPSRNVP